MNDYSISLFLHIVGALGFFAALGIEWLVIHQLRRATTAEGVRDWLRIGVGGRKFGMISMVLLLAAGIYMMNEVWGHATAWINVSFWSIVLLGILIVPIGRRLKAIEAAVQTETGPLSARYAELLRHPLLMIAIRARVGVALGIIFLMTVKPNTTESVLTIGIGALAGILLGVLTTNSAKKMTVVRE